MRLWTILPEHPVPDHQAIPKQQPKTIPDHQTIPEHQTIPSQQPILHYLDLYSCRGSFP